MNLSKPPSNNNSRDLPPGFDKPKDLDDDQKKTAVHAELNRMSLLPSNSSYAIHRMKVLNKLLHLLSIKRTITQDEELELLFSGLSI